MRGLTVIRNVYTLVSGRSSKIPVPHVDCLFPPALHQLCTARWALKGETSLPSWDLHSWIPSRTVSFPFPPFHWAVTILLRDVLSLWIATKYNDKGKTVACGSDGIEYMGYMWIAVSLFAEIGNILIVGSINVTSISGDFLQYQYFHLKWDESFI